MREALRKEFQFRLRDLLEASSQGGWVFSLQFEEKVRELGRLTIAAREIANLGCLQVVEFSTKEGLGGPSK